MFWQVMASDGDCIKGIMQLLDGYDPSIRHDSPNATCLRWFFTGFFQTLVGLLLLVVSFILSMQSTTVIDLTLNLTGLHFIQELDDMGFKIAAAGLISKRTQDDCHHVADLNRQPTPKHLKQKAKVTKRMLIVALAIGLLVPYFFAVRCVLLQDRVTVRSTLVNPGYGVQDKANHILLSAVGNFMADTCVLQFISSSAIQTM
jgi:hypothetical protein